MENGAFVENKEKKQGLTGFDLKIIAIITMFIDHAATILMEKVITVNVGGQLLNSPIDYAYLFLRGIGRLAFPIYIFLLVEGFKYTKNKAKYALRLGIFALISEIPFDLGFKGSFFDPTYQNVFFTLLLGFLFMWVTEYIYSKDIKPILGYLGITLGTLALGSYTGIIVINLFYASGIDLTAPTSMLLVIALSAISILAISIYSNRYRTFGDLSRLGYSLLVLALCMYLADMFQTDYSSFGVLAIAACFCFRLDKRRASGMAVATLILSSTLEAVALIDIPVLMRYNGQRGKSMKYFFYVFYPAHILVLTMISYIIK